MRRQAGDALCPRLRLGRCCSQGVSPWLVVVRRQPTAAWRSQQIDPGESVMPLTPPSTQLVRHRVLWPTAPSSEEPPWPRRITTTRSRPAEARMRIALLSNFWYRRGGLERVMFADAEGLAARGHTIAPFASAHRLNENTPYSRFFPTSVEHGDLGGGMGKTERARTAFRLFHNGPAVSAFGRFLDEFRPDVVHQHGTSRQLSPSVLARAKSAGVPTVLTLHDFSVCCPAAILSRVGERECLAVSCAGHRYDRAVRFRCVHGSALASAIAAMELLVTRALHRYERAVDLFLVPSTYVARRMLQSGLPVHRLRVLPNAIEEPDEDEVSIGSLALSYGRLVDYKGFDMVVRIARALPDVSFVIAGDGPERAALERQADGLGNLSFTGHLSGRELTELIRRARVILVPSQWPEPFGMVVLEAWREGKPVIVTRRGALGDIVEHERTGLIIEPTDTRAAVAAVRYLMDDVERARTLGEAGRRQARVTYSMAAHLDRTERLYAELSS
jgi:glycosyltransferase involved in cell wall biosynthesis